MLKKVLLFFIYFISSVFFATPIYAGIIDAPALKCISVNSNGNVILSWTIPVNTGGSFESYHIYVASNVNGPYTILDSVSFYAQSSYTHVGAKLSSPLYYYVKTRFYNPSLTYSNTSDTLKTIVLDVANSSNGIASLSWNTLHTTISNSGKEYQIYREYPSNTWSLLDSTQNLRYIDTISICSSVLNYKIEITDASGCTSVSSIDGSLFQDITVPVTPQIDTVSVNASGDAVIGWSKNPSKDVKGYIVYQFITGFGSPLDTVFGINSTSYINNKSTADISFEEYCIAAFDSCGNTSPMGDIHNSIYVSATPNVCNAEYTLTWNNYNIMLDIAGYNIYVSINGGTFNLLATNAANNTTYKHTGLIPLTNYCYLVQAFNSSGTKTSSSNRLCYFANLPIDPKFAYLKTATVKGENNVVISCFVDTAADIIQYKLLRAETKFGFYTKIGSIAASSNPLVDFTDLSAKTNTQSYYYKLVAVDSCGNDKISSNISRTILLTVTENDDMTNTLIWNDYEQWLGTVSSYNIYRAVDGFFNPVPIANIPFENNGNNSFVDDISTYVSGEGIFSYYIEAVEGNENPYSFSETSRSNITEVFQYPNFFIPNAFIPSGINTIFIPKGGFFDKNEYEFFIFNRWGEKIFGTNNFFDGWDGTYKNKEAEAGVYVYSIRFKTAKGKYIEKSGSVTLIR